MARFGRAVGLKGEVKLHLLTDFPETLKGGKSFLWEKGTLTLRSFNPHSNQARFDEINSREEAALLTNHLLYTTMEKTLQECTLEEGEHFWFEIVGCEVMEEGERLGKVEGIERLGAVDYLIIQTDPLLQKALGIKRFLVPYIDRFVLLADVKNRLVECSGAKGILEAS
ncbi:21K [Wolinella succinogenes]|nr:21K [Wolinella succinogenes]